MNDISPEVSKYFSELAKKRKDNKRGFSDPMIVKKALETRKRNAIQKEKDSKRVK
jgi:hypothetical protein